MSLLSVIVRTAARWLIPFMQLFGLYVIIHGHASPGGGFQGGVIVATSMILYAIVFGLAEARKRATQRLRLVMESAGPLIYALIGVLGILVGGVFLEYRIIPLPYEPHITSEIMISIIEIAIGIGVMALCITMFYALAAEEVK
ncbi:MAG: MnhB domain-containing protein [Methanocellales archaeon]|nr:MnhB domain-containing protein [Methanocellales archaeon]